MGKGILAASEPGFSQIEHHTFLIRKSIRKLHMSIPPHLLAPSVRRNTLDYIAAKDPVGWGRCGYRFDSYIIDVA